MSQQANLTPCTVDTRLDNGDLVCFMNDHTKSGIITSINTDLGYRILTILLPETGDTMDVFPYQVSKITDAADILCEVDMVGYDEIGMTDPIPSHAATGAPCVDQPRHHTPSEMELDELAAKTQADSTHKQTSWALKIFKDWLCIAGEPTDFENLEPAKMNQLLRRFYGSVRTQDGQLYSKSAMVNIRSGLNRHLQSPSHNRNINIMNDRDFLGANKVFVGQLRNMRSLGLDISQHKSAIDSEDATRLYTSGVLGTEDPVSLQRKVFFEVSLHFARRGREGLRELVKSSFEVGKDAKGVEFVFQPFNEKEKNHQGGESKRPFEKSAIMYSIKESPNCPVRSFKLYLAKLHPQCEAFFQLPNTNFKENGQWYKKQALGKNKIGDMMKNISVAAKLSRVYTNHCIRATAATALHQQGVPVEDIRHVTGHRNTQSLDSYISGPSMQKRQQMSGLLTQYAQPEQSRQHEALEQKPEPDENQVITEAFMRSDSPKEGALAEQTVAVPSICTSAIQTATSHVFHNVQFTGNCVINVNMNK